MATKKQKEELVNVLKFTPRDITISLSGYGGEIVMGRITEEQYDFWRDRDDLHDFVYDWDGEMDVPADMRFCTDGAWHDVDDLCHESGCEASDCCIITVYDELESRDLWESHLDIDHLEDQGVDISSHSHCRPEETEPSGTCVFMGQNFEKGTFFSGTVRITQPFDHRKLSISWTDCDGWRLIGGVEYAGEEVEGYDGYSTTGKSMEFRVYQVENDNEWDPAAELDKIVAPSDAEPETWDGIEVTPWYSMEIRPELPGEYQVMQGTWPFPTRAEWTGKKWKAVGTVDTKDLTQWRGLTRPAK